MAIDTTYQIQPGETIAQYNARIQAYNASKGDYEPEDRSDLTSFTSQPTNSSQQPAANNPSTNATSAAAMTDQQFQSWLNSQNLDDGQKQAVQAIYNAVSTNDKAQADKIASAMSAAYEYSDPYFKSQIKMALDTLNAGIQGKQNDLAFQMQQQQNTLTDLQNNVAAAKDKLSFDAQQQLQQLATKYQQDMDTTRDNLAATGFTSSSRRAQQESYIQQANNQAVASTNHTLAYNLGQQDASLAQGQRNYNLNIQHLQDLAQQGELQLYRTAEGQVGSSNLPSISGLTPLGGIGGDIPENQVKDATSFANSFL